MHILYRLYNNAYTQDMKIYLGADHNGYHLKEKIFAYLIKRGHEVEDVSEGELDPSDDFPEFAQAARAAFERVLAVAERFAPGDGARVALAGWSLAHGFSHLAIDSALDDLPIPVPIDASLARGLADLLLPLSPRQAKSG